MDYDNLSKSKAAFLSRFGTQENTDKIMGSSNDANKTSVVDDSPHLKPEHIEQIMSGDNTFAKIRAIKRNKFIKPEHISAAIHSGKDSLIMNALSHPLASESDITMGIAHNDPLYNIGTMKNPSLNEKHIDIALTSKDPLVLEMAMKHPSFNEGHIKKIFAGDNNSLKHAAISTVGTIDNPKSWNMLKLASNDSDPWVASAAKRKLDANNKQQDEDMDLLKELNK